MKYGYFEDNSNEYVITNPDTPRPWCNYLGNAQFGGLITNNAAGYTFYKSAALGRLTRFQFNALPANWNGRYVYLRNEANGDFWSASWMPVSKPLDQFKYECRHGTGYTRIQSTYREITCSMTCFVPLQCDYEVWSIVINNGNRTPCSLKVFPFVEPQCNWSADDDTRNLQYNQYISAAQSPVPGLIDIGSNVNMPEDTGHLTNKDQGRHTFFALTGATPAGYDADLTGFLGRYGNYARPAAVMEGRCGNTSAYGDMPAAAFEVPVNLQPGESQWLAVAFGVGSAETKGREVLRQIASQRQAEEALQEVKHYWHRRLNTLSANTPEAAFNSMVNLWAPYNNLITFYWSRTASLVYAGERDGLGYRDTLQDMVGSASLIPEETRQRLELMLTGQYAHGGCKPVVQPFNHHPGQEMEPDHFRADDGMWLFNAVPAYVRETGDLAFFNKVLPFADCGEATVLGHLRRAMEFTITRSGTHGLPCGLYADWNDCIRLGEKGESVFVAMQLRYSLSEYITISQLLDKLEEVEWATQALAKLDEAIDKHAWDGQWYLRAYRFDGLRFGSHSCEEGRIFMNPQVWAVISGHAEGERGRDALDAMHDHLNTEYGLMLCTPPYVSTDPEVCLGRLFNPGTKENGGIFNHTQGWAVMAAAKLGMGDRAYEYLRNVLPARFNELAEVREVEPYVVCQSTHSSFSPRFGTGRVSWLSGSAVWNYVAMTTAILGIQPDYDGLRVAPCIPSHWTGFEVTRKFRGATYAIRVRNPDGKQCGVRELKVDGKVVPGNKVKPVAHGSHCQIEVTL